MAALCLVFEVQPKSLSQVLGCIADHMVLGLMTMGTQEVQVLDHLLMVDQHIEDQVQRIFHPIQENLDTLVSAQEVRHMDQDIQDLAMALAAVQEDQLRGLMHWEVHWVWTLEDHQGTCFHQSLEEALALQGFHLLYIHVDWVFSEPEGREAGCPVWSLGLQEN